MPSCWQNTEDVEEQARLQKKVDDLEEQARSALKKIHLHNRRRGRPSKKAVVEGILGDCSICCCESLDVKMSEGQLGRLDCDHAFCFACIDAWTRQQSSSCPLCAKQSSELRRCSDDGIVCKTPIRPTERRQRSYIASSDMASELDRLEICPACGRGDSDEARILICDGCGRYWHMDCIRLCDVPDGDWFCPDCVSS